MLTEWRRLEPRRRRKMLAPPPAEFLTSRRLKPARQPDFTAASRKRFGGAAEGSMVAYRWGVGLTIARSWVRLLVGTLLSGWYFNWWSSVCRHVNHLSKWLTNTKIKELKRQKRVSIFDRGHHGRPTPPTISNVDLASKFFQNDGLLAPNVFLNKYFWAKKIIFWQTKI